MKKKILAMVLCLSVLSTATACGQAGEEKESSDSNPASYEVSVSTKESSSTEVNEEPVTITMEIYDRGNYQGFIDVDKGDTVADNKIVNLLKEAALEELNINIEYVPISNVGAEDKLQALMAAETEPDIFFTYTADRFLKWATDGALADLTDYVNNTEEGKVLSEFLGEAALNFGQLGGKQYAINGRANNLSQLCSFIRKDLVEAVGMELLEVNGHYAMTPSMLKEAMIKIKEEGFVDFPYGILNLWQCYSPITGAFVDDEAFDSKELLIQNAEDTFFLLDGTKESYRFLNECYNEGLIHPDFVLHALTNLQEMVTAGDCAFWSFAAWQWLSQGSAVNQFHIENPDAEVVAVEIVQEDLSPARYYKANPGTAWGMVSSNCENVEAAVKLISWLNTDETAHLLTNHGIEGETYTVDADGDYVLTDGAYFGGNQDMNMWLNNCKCTQNEEDFLRAFRKRNTENDPKNITAYEDAFRIATSEGKEFRVVPSAVIEAQSEWAADLAENKDNLIIQSITTSTDKFDEVYDSYFEIYMEEGGKQIAEERLATLQK